MLPHQALLPWLQGKRGVGQGWDALATRGAKTNNGGIHEQEQLDSIGRAIELLLLLLPFAADAALGGVCYGQESCAVAGWLSAGSRTNCAVRPARAVLFVGESHAMPMFDGSRENTAAICNRSI